MHCHYF